MKAPSRFAWRNGTSIVLTILIFSSGAAKESRTFFFPNPAPFLNDSGKNLSWVFAAIVGKDAPTWWNENISPHLTAKEEGEEGLPINRYCEPPHPVEPIDFDEELNLSSKDLPEQIKAITEYAKENGAHCKTPGGRQLFQTVRTSDNGDGIVELCTIGSRGEYSLCAFAESTETGSDQRN